MRNLLQILLRQLRDFDLDAKRRFGSFLKSAQQEPYAPLYTLFRTACLAICLIGLFNLLPLDGESLGQRGDFFGGVLNPILTFITFSGLLLTIVLQQTELRDSREQFKRSADALVAQHDSMNAQAFETTLFQMLRLHTEIVRSISHNKGKDEIIYGRDCFDFFAKQIRSHIKKEIRPNVDVRRQIENGYQRFWNDHKYKINQYFRHLLHLIKFIESHKINEADYRELLNAQLSNQEMAVLFYHCLSSHGEQFKELIERYGLLRGMPPDELAVVNSYKATNHADLIAPSTFGTTDIDS